jgi:hypothetical protein
MQGQKAFPIVQLSSRAKNNQYGTIDPIFRVTGWVPSSKFAAITGDDAVETPALAAPISQAPKSASAPAKRSTVDIIDDTIPF